MASSIDKSISSIPVKVIGTTSAKPAKTGAWRWKRRAVQILAIVFAILIPVSGLFRIDPVAGAFVVLDRQIWFSDFFLVSGVWIMLASSLIMFYSVGGTAFCGWVCPQNTLAEWANHLTHKLLGKRVEVSLTGEAPKVAAAKNKLANWALLGLAFWAAAMFFAVIPLFYFYPPDVVWSFMTLRPDARLAGSLYWIYTVCVLIIFLDIAVIRHFWCRFSCIYKVWQHSFKTKQTLHVAYDASRADECAKCSYCVTACFIDLDPRKTQLYDSCINCGDCIDACNRLHAKQQQSGLLRFELGERGGGALSRFRTNAVSLIGRVRWTAPLGLLGAAMCTWGMWTYEPYHVSVYQAEVQPGNSIQDYRIALSNKVYHPAQLSVRVTGLAAGSYRLGAAAVTLPAVGRSSVVLAVAPDLPRGLYPIVVDVATRDGWARSFRIQHFSAGG